MKTQMLYKGKRFYKSMVTINYVFYSNYSEANDDCNVIMFDRETEEIISDNYFANTESLKLMRLLDFESVSRTCKTKFKCILDKEILPAFEAWIEDGNVIKTKFGYSTQDAQYANLLKTKKDLLKYFVREFEN